mgnify:CR=1 FL=1
MQQRKGHGVMQLAWGPTQHTPMIGSFLAPRMPGDPVQIP